MRPREADITGITAIPTREIVPGKGLAAGLRALLRRDRLIERPKGGKRPLYMLLPGSQVLLRTQAGSANQKDTLQRRTEMANVVPSPDDPSLGLTRTTVLDLLGYAVIEAVLGRVAYGYAEDLDGKKPTSDICPLGRRHDRRHRRQSVASQPASTGSASGRMDRRQPGWAVEPFSSQGDTQRMDPDRQSHRHPDDDSGADLALWVVPIFVENGGRRLPTLSR